MAARTLLLKMQERGWIELPPRRMKSPTRSGRPPASGGPALKESPVACALAAVVPLRLREVSQASPTEARRQLEAALHRYHYLGYRSRVPEAPAQFTFVFGVRWCSRGISAPRINGVLLGRLPQALRGWSEITDLYVNKFGQPQPGSRVFIATRQFINGRKDALKWICADVPPPEGSGKHAPG